MLDGLKSNTLSITSKISSSEYLLVPKVLTYKLTGLATPIAYATSISIFFYFRKQPVLSA